MAINAHEALQLFISIKTHFNSPNYDAIKYHFKTKRRSSLDKRPDKFFFYKLAKHPDPKGMLLANFSHTPTIWIGELFEPAGLERYYQWKKYKEGLTYFFNEEIKQLDHDSFKVIKQTHPKALQLYLANKLCLDTLTILNDFIMFSKVWDIEMKDDLVWEMVRFKINKYQPFVIYNPEKIIKYMKQHFFVDIL